MPSVMPSLKPTIHPSIQPSEMPTVEPTKAPHPPTARPSPKNGAPTFAPTHDISYMFSVTQTLDGIDEETFNDDTNNWDAFAAAVAMAIPPLTSENVEIDEAVNATMSRRVLRALMGEAVDVTYTISYTLAETGFTDAESAYNYLVNNLDVAIVQTELFNGYIEVAASVNNSNAPQLLGTTTNSYHVTAFTLTGTDDDSKPAIHQHTALVTGLVVGLGFGLIWIFGIYFCIFGCGPRQSYAAPSTVVDSAADLKDATPVTDLKDPSQV